MPVASLAGGSAGTWGLRVAGAIVVVVLLLRAYVAPSSAPASLLSAGVDGAILGGLALLWSTRATLSHRVPAVADAVFVGVLLLYGTLLFWHAYFLDIAGEYRFSLMGVSVGLSLFFARYLVPLRAWLVFGGFWFLIALSGRWAALDRIVPLGAGAWSAQRRRWVGGFAIGCGFLGAGTVAEQHPLSATLHDAVLLVRGGSVISGEGPMPIDHLDLHRTDAWPTPSQFRRVLVFVMEGVPQGEFAAALERLPSHGSFFHEVAPYATKYDGYYTVDQESRTARMAMLHSLMIPYEAYVSDWTERFGFLLEQGGLVDLLRGNGWQAAVAIPLVELPLDLRMQRWDLRLGVTGADMKGAGFLCLEPTRFDRGCEDRILLDALDPVLGDAGPWFLFQPFLFGHTSRWEETTGVERVQYYDRYLAAVLDRLRERAGLEETLIVVTSDHGPRTPKALERASSYQVPLWLVHPSFPAETRKGHFTNVEFRDLLLETMGTGRPPSAPRRPLVMSMGPSTRSLFMCASESGESAVLRISRNGRVSALSTSEGAGAFPVRCARTFFRYRDHFDAQREARSGHPGG